ncbi:MAG TPA: hypothetical protein VHC22_19160 [Pirellulales bacterium]|nr:hypothetical protein [Pirellulales bacterium]
MIIDAVKHSLETMDRRFLELSGLIFDPYTDELLRELGESQEKLLERPFAYEFYHQMRTLWDNRSPLVAHFADVVIQGEVDKGYQAISGLDRVPDFLLHRPNSDERNFAVIEVKLAAFARDIERDLNKFVAFRNRRGYQHFVEIVIGHEAELRRVNLDGLNQKGDWVIEVAVVLFNTDDWKATDHRISRINPERRSGEYV